MPDVGFFDAGFVGQRLTVNGQQPFTTDHSQLTFLLSFLQQQRPFWLGNILIIIRAIHTSVAATITTL